MTNRTANMENNRNKMLRNNILFSGVLKIVGLLTSLVIVPITSMLLICNLFYKLWIGNMVDVPLSVSASTLVYVCFFNLNNCATFLINGLNKIFVQIIISLSVTALYIITVLAIGGKLGVEGIVLSMAASYAVMSVVHIYQCHKLINGNADGVWNK